MHPLLTSFLLLAAAAGSPLVAPRARPPLVRQDDQAFETLEKEYDSAALEWRSQLRDAKKTEDSADEEALLAQNPVKEYYPRFATLAEGGSARAAFWMATRVEDVETKPDVIREQKTRLFSRAVSALAATDEAKDLLKALTKQNESLEPQTLEGLLLDFAGASKDVELGSKALYERAKHMMDRATSDEERAKAFAALEELAKKYPTSKAARGVEDLLYANRNLKVGCTAPEFTTEDVDGASFRLADYRGKVVLIDFWGFW